jgi:hypothetical protein
LNGTPIGRIDRFVETGEDYILNCIAPVQFRDCFPHRNLDGEIDGEPVDAATDGWECETPQTMVACNVKTGYIATCK